MTPSVIVEKDAMTNEPHNKTTQEPQRWLWVIAGIIVFSVLMGLRAQVEPTWLRAVCAAVAAAALALGIIQFKTKKT